MGTLTSPSQSRKRAPSLVLETNSCYLPGLPCDQWHTAWLGSVRLSLPFGHLSPTKLTCPPPSSTKTYTHAHKLVLAFFKILPKLLGKIKLCFWLEFLFEHFSEGLVYILNVFYSNFHSKNNISNVSFRTAQLISFLLKHYVVLRWF